MTVPLNSPEVVYTRLPIATREEVEEVAERWLEAPHDAYNLGDGAFTREEIALALAFALTEYMREVWEELDWHMAHDRLGYLVEQALKRAAVTPGIAHGPIPSQPAPPPGESP